MEPGRTYVTVLPGRKRPAFVRRRRDPLDKPSGIIQAPVTIRPRSYSTERFHREVPPCSEPNFKYIMGPPPPRMIPFAPSSAPQQPPMLVLPPQHSIHHEQPYPPMYIQQASMTYPAENPLPLQVINPPPEPETRITEGAPSNIKKDGLVQKHTCSACGKLRSASYCARHPLAPGEVPRLSTCRRCIREQTSSEESNAEEFRHRKKSLREKDHKEQKSGRKRRGRRESSYLSRQSSSDLENICIVQRAHSSSKNHAHRHSSRSSSIGSTSDRQRLRLAEKFRVVKRTIYVDASPRRSISESRMHSLHGDLRYERRVESRDSKPDSYNHIRNESPIPHQWSLVENEYDHLRKNEHSSVSALRQFPNSIRARKTTPYRAEREESLEDARKSDFVYTGRRSHPSARTPEESYDYDPNYDGPPPPPPPLTRSARIVKVTRHMEDSAPVPTRSARIVKVTMDRDNSARPQRTANDQFEERVPRAALMRSASYQSPLPRPIMVESAESRRARGQDLWRRSIIVEKQDESDEYSPPGN